VKPDETAGIPDRFVEGVDDTVIDCATIDTTFQVSGQPGAGQEPNATILLRCPHCGATRPVKNPEIAELLRAATTIQASIHGVAYDCKQCGKLTVFSTDKIDW
jgi:DNA-directed RNA polymerase subunit RPC12/RpoP